MNETWATIQIKKMYWNTYTTKRGYDTLSYSEENTVYTPT